MCEADGETIMKKTRNTIKVGQSQGDPEQMYDHWKILLDRWSDFKKIVEDDCAKHTSNAVREMIKEELLAVERVIGFG